VEKRFPFGLRVGTIQEIRPGAGVTIGDALISAGKFNGLEVSSGKVLNSIAAELVTAGTGVTVTDYYSGSIHRTVCQMTARAMAIAKGTGSTGYGSQLLFTAPLGAIAILGVSTVLTAAVTASWNPTTPVAGIGTTAAAVDNATLTTTEVDILASTSLTVSADATALKVLGPATLRPVFDGSSAAKDVYLNVACNSDPGAAKSLTWTGKVYVLWAFLGDLT
jgi:hypothetical protein